ncbi:MAG: hypothetical protein IJH40_04145 [Ruminococcus sp.]|uniref:hypothetical protein n=1 Tax=Ruminococcus sp. TaxID=41978 RepID=UPI002873AAB0|nr:hypothetical protein [Ruminococcus sp.]MBQ3284814.1 hypothetical protein [Ruminococcus sp.]
MKLKFLLAITALILALCFTLAACGKQQSGGATADTATADTAETVDNAPAPSTASSSASSEEETTASAASSEAEASPSPAPAANIGNNEDILYEDDTPAQEEQREEDHEQQSSASSSKASSAASSSASSASSGNPAYQDDNKPVFTIAMTNKKTKKTYSASCSYATDKEDIAYASFFLPGGEYDVAVYEYTESRDKGDPLAEATYKNPIAEDKRKSIRVNYTPKDKKIEVTASTSSRTQ